MRISFPPTGLQSLRLLVPLLDFCFMPPLVIVLEVPSLIKGPKAEGTGVRWSKGNAHSNFVRLRTSTPAPALEELDNTPLRAVVAARAAAAVAPTPEGATPAVAASAPLTGATTVAPASLGSAPVLRI